MNTTMIGRNDPCPCGSGKKYKKCHGAKNVVDLGEVIEHELASIIQKYIESTLPERNTNVEFDQFYKEWSHKLAALGDKASKQLTLGYYLFTKRSDWWQSYLNKQKGQRPAVLETLEDWGNPLPVIGQVVEMKDGYLHMKEILSGAIYRIPSDLQQKEALKGTYCSSVLLPEKRKGTDVYTYSLSFDFLPSFVENGAGTIKELTRTSNVTVEDFYEKHYLDALLALSQAEELSPENLALLNELETFIEGYGPEKETLLTFFESYLTSKKPSPRKPSALVAAAVRFGKDNKLLPNDWTNKQIGEQFGVSTGTIQKYFEEMVEFRDTAS